MRWLAGALAMCVALPAVAFPAAAQSRADTLRGTNGPARTWWDVTFYDLEGRVSPEDSSLVGSNAITYRVLSAGEEMQIDLQPPMVLDSVLSDGRRLRMRSEGSAHFARVTAPPRPGEVATVVAHFSGRPVVAANPPWDGGYQWETDSSGLPWVATSNQGLGASVWWPNKDLQSEEPDSQRVAVTVPDPLLDVSNGRLRSTRGNGDGTTTYEWFVSSPVNNYGISVNAGSYAHWREELEGESGVLTLDFWPLAENLARARAQWTQARTTLQCFEHWFGPYPWYEDGFKLIEVPYLGMEHQSAVTYGNGYRNGYAGTDLSGTGWGLQWDFIIVHESAHEWWGNHVTAEDMAENWLHEGFANYAESLYTECLTGSERAGAEYVIGTRARILNDRPIVAETGIAAEGSGDMYYKGGNLLHTIRQIFDDDEAWRAALRGIQAEFGPRVVRSAEVEAYLARVAGVDLGPVFDQYLRTARLPVLEWRRTTAGLSYRWADVVEGFAMPVRVAIAGETVLLEPSTAWKTLETRTSGPATLTVDTDFYVEAREVADR